MVLSRYLSTFICVLFIAAGAVSGIEKKVGDKVSFRPDKPLPSPVTSIIWKHRNSAGIVVKAIEWDEGEILIPNSRFKDFTTVDEKTGQITITNLKSEHSGVYTIDINSKEQEQRFNLTVMEQVPKPVIEVEEIEDNPDVVYLACKYSEKIIWKNSAGEELKISKLHPTGESITVKKREGNPDNVYTCTLKNAVSEETSEPVYKDKLFKEESNTAVIGGIISGVSILIIIIIIFIVLYLIQESVHKSVNKHCSCLEGSLDCFLKTAETGGQQNNSVPLTDDSNGATLKGDEKNQESKPFKENEDKKEEEQQ